jgi:hypothetical protein
MNALKYVQREGVISCLSERQMASQEGLCSALITWLLLTALDLSVIDSSLRP